ncbi:hypothetical protein [Actinoallomurus rhizosphaericola]|uniref:hypothetical protein n=1 Tax=Actinoallomurus rhizosphaericola TaxID=2952536 RepID=UPI0020933136|nr:hypothetical protein [Actinoallomurus rhizosphaericola]MCO5998920.1 hypothetical protein [Actinoallomurus rhizosphaericola]
MKTVIAADVPIRAQDPAKAARPGSILRQSLLAETADDALSFRLIRSQYQDGELAFESPRHHHAFQQVRWTESGSVNYAPGQDIPEGDLAYFPRGAYYGPQRKDQGIALLLQYGFGDEFLHRHGRAGEDDAEQELRKLRESGTFTGGEYLDTDPATGETRRRDAVQAIYDARSDGDFTVPAAGYEAPILIHPAAFTYYTAGPGVEVKPLGSFHDHPGPYADLRISTVRLTGDAAWTFTADRAQVAWTTRDGLHIDGRPHPAITCLYSARGETDTVHGTDGVELIVLDMPRLN